MSATVHDRRRAGGSTQSLRFARLGLTHATARTLAIILLGLALLLVLTLVLANSRNTVAEATLSATLTQADTIAAAIDADNEVPRGPAAAASNADVMGLESLIAGIVAGSDSRVQLFSDTGARLIDSTPATRRGQSEEDSENEGVLPRAGLVDWLVNLTLAAPRVEPAADVVAPDLVQQALSGVKFATRRLVGGSFPVTQVITPLRDSNGQPVAALAVQSGLLDIATPARRQELGIISAFGIAAGLVVLGAMLVGAAMARPLVSLVRTAERIAEGHYDTAIATVDAPGEIGQLSRALDEMTQALYMRIDAIESFAGEVAHELKNPLTSLRSAVETFPLAKTDESRARLLDVIQHDVRRIDRLISDISDASKLDAELNRRGYEQFGLDDLLTAVVSSQNERAQDRDQRVTLATRGHERVGDLDVIGNKGRLGQVFINLLDNARSFTPEGGTVSVTATRFNGFIEVVLDDDGPGIAPQLLERIFERFYTDRSQQQSFGDNSGLGLAISRQIVNAHGGELFAENRYTTSLGPNKEIRGARMTVRLPTVR